MNNAEHTNSDIRKIKIHLWAITIIIILVMIVISTANYYNYKKNQTEIENLIITFSDTLLSSKHNVIGFRDSVEVLNYEITINKKREDSLKSRIKVTLDSLELMNDRLQLMIENSNLASEIINNILDSIEIYRRQTNVLKEQIAQINTENSLLLQIEKNKNATLRQQISEYEKRLMSMFAINMSVQAYEDGFDQNRRLITTDIARQVVEIAASFTASRDIEPSDYFTIELQHNSEVIFTSNKFTVNNKQVRVSLLIPSGKRLTAGSYYAVIYHNNDNYSINHVRLGRQRFVFQ